MDGQSKDPNPSDISEGQWELALLIDRCDSGRNPGSLSARRFKEGLVRTSPPLAMPPQNASTWNRESLFGRKSIGVRTERCVDVRTRLHSSIRQSTKTPGSGAVWF